MSSPRRRRLTWSLILLPLLTLSLGAQTPEAVPLIDTLEMKEDPLVRADLFRQLLEQDFDESPDAPDRLLVVLERENKLIEEVLRESNGFVGVATRYGEEYSDYYLSLLSTVNRISNLQDQRVLDALTNASYGPMSPFAVRLVREHGERMANLLLAKSSSDLYVFRMAATELLGTLVAEGMLSEGTYEAVRAAITRNTGDEEIIVRATAVDTLAQVGDLGDLPLLEQIARSDPGEIFTLVGDLRRYPVRESAERAIAEIQRRHPL